MANKKAQYRVTVKPVLERRECISAAEKNSLETAKFFHFQARQHSLKLVTIPIDYLVYRVENARTRDDQLNLARFTPFHEHVLSRSVCEWQVQDRDVVIA